MKKERKVMVTSEKTGIDFNFHHCDIFASLYTGCKGIENMTGQKIRKRFLKMTFSLFQNAKGVFLFVVVIGKNNKGIEADRLIPSDKYEAIAFASLLTRINKEQRQNCRNCNPKFTDCIVIEKLRSYKKELAIIANS